MVAAVMVALFGAAPAAAQDGPGQEVPPDTPQAAEGTGDASARAQPTTGEDVDATVRTMVLRDTVGIDADVADAVDGELLRALREVAGVDEPTASPVAFRELAAAAGCGEADASCLPSIAQDLEVQAVVFRRLEPTDTAIQLTLVYYDPHISDQPPHVREVLAPGSDLGATMDGAVRSLFGIPEPPAEVASPEEPRRQVEPAPGHVHDTSVHAYTVIVLGTGALVLIGAAVAGVLSLNAQSDYEDAEIVTRADADRALDDLQAAEDRATAANVMFMAGAAITLTGAVMLALDLGLAADTGHPVDVAVGATPDGASLSVAGRFGSL